MTPKICPMTFGSVKNSPYEFQCVKDKCAWWIERGEKHGKSGCALKYLALSMGIFVSEQKHFIMAMEKHR